MSQFNVWNFILIFENFPKGSASDCVLVSLLGARHAALVQLQKQYPNADEATLLSKLVAYCSKEVRTFFVIDDHFIETKTFA